MSLPDCVYFKVPSYSVKVLFHAEAFDDVMTFKYLMLKFDYIKNENSFQSEIKPFFLVSKLPF